MLGQVGGWGTSWPITPLPLTGILEFDFFVTLVLAGGLLATMIGWAFNVLTRS